MNAIKKKEKPAYSVHINSDCLSTKISFENPLLRTISCCIVIPYIRTSLSNTKQFFVTKDPKHSIAKILQNLRFPITKDKNEIPHICTQKPMHPYTFNLSYHTAHKNIPKYGNFSSTGSIVCQSWNVFHLIALQTHEKGILVFNTGQRTRRTLGQ